MEQYLLRLEFIGIDKGAQIHTIRGVTLEDSVFYTDVEKLMEKVEKFVEIVRD